MEESSVLSETLNFLSLGLSVVLLLAVAYLWSQNSRKTEELKLLQSDSKKLKKKLKTLEEKVSEIREPKVISEVPQIEAFGIGSDESRDLEMLSMASKSLWENFIQDYNDFAAELASPGQLRKCEKFVRENKLKILTYGNSKTFRPAIDVKDSIYWAFKFSDDEFAVVPNPMNPCDEELVEYSGIKEIYAINYQDGTYRKYFVKLPAIATSDQSKGWLLKNNGVVNLER
ncbi:MAG: hypothetical protein IKZ53_02670 [Selenomonadaceae bacterium]|nr:hypothetical protein [Selenomonadaceae bacterium]